MLAVNKHKVNPISHKDNKKEMKEEKVMKKVIKVHKKNYIHINRGCQPQDSTTIEDI